MIISVPNALTEIRPYLTRTEYAGVAGAGGNEVGRFSKFYGLPSCKPCDRHRWFFSYTEAEMFFRNLAGKLQYVVIEEVPVGAVGRSFAGSAARFIVKHTLGEDSLKDLFYSTYWCVLEKLTPDTGLPSAKR